MPLLNDPADKIQHVAAHALSKMAQVSKDAAEEMVAKNVIPPLIENMPNRNVSFIYLRNAQLQGGE